MILRHCFVQAVTLVVGVATASAGVLIVGTYTGTKTPKGRTVEFRIQDGHGKITSQEGQAIYYDHTKRTIYIVDSEKGTVIPMDEAGAKMMSERLAEAQKRIEEQMKTMPPEQRAMVEKMMKEQGGGLPPPGQRTPLKFAKSGGGKVGTWPCETYSGTADGRTVEVCTAAPAALGIKAEDEAVFEGFLDLSQEMAGESGAGVGAGPERGFEGIPLERSESRQGKVTDRFTIETIKPEKMSTADLKVPTGMKELTPGAPPPRP
ncbi:MAG: hypothetical protein ABIR79_01665 [Candidatus Binatia bacterium]